ncbi:MAG: hypothetical protein JO103_01425, partial [Candidatus Eremiobacteraeota bacterium]|nr:hypothetical protein [Candidatus Eremiobacteraeota bacterium]
MNWCWAAVAKAIVDHYGGPTHTQCEYATRFLEQHETCCNGNERTNRCDVPHDVDSVLAAHGVYAAPAFRRPIRLETILRELQRDRPIVALMAFADVVHAVVITAVDVTEGVIGFADPSFGSPRFECEANDFAIARDEDRYWVHTILTRPNARFQRVHISYMHERITRHEKEYSRDAQRITDPLELNAYEAHPSELIAGEGLRNPEFLRRRTYRLDADWNDPSAGLFERALTPMRDEIESRIAVGYEVRVLTCHPIHLRALWFTRPTDDPPHRT